MERIYEIITNFEHRGQFSSIERIQGMLPYDKDLYRSYYFYEMQAASLAKEKKSVSDYRGCYGLDEVLLDIDGHDDLLKGLDALIQVLNKLIKAYDVPEQHMMVWFSGGGFHLVMPPALFGPHFTTPSPSLPGTVAATMNNLFPEADNLYYPTAVIRVGQSFNVKRGFWKVPVPMDMIFRRDIDAIKALGKSGEVSEIDYDLNVRSAVLEPLVLQVSNARAHADKQTGGRFPLPAKSQVSNVVTCMQHLYNRGEEQGRRNTDLLRLVSWWRRSQLHYDLILDLAYNWASTLDPAEVKKVVDYVFDKDYRYGCNDSVRSEFCDARCIFFARKNEGDQSIGSATMDNQMQAYAASDAFNNPIDLGRFYKVSPFYCYPGEYIVLAGDTGLNKTALFQNWAYLVRPKTVLYISTEVDRILLYRRFVQIAADMSKFDVMKQYRAGLVPPNTDKLDHIRIVDEAMELGDLTRMALDIAPDIIMVDVLEDIGRASEKSNDRIDAAARGMKALAMSTRSIVFAVSHISKSAASMPLDTRSPKGSSAVVQKADKAFGLSGNRNDPIGNRRLVTLKARDETPMNLNLQIEIKNWRFRNVTK